MTSSAWGTNDDDLLAELRSALSSAPSPPERTLQAARGAFAWRTIDADLDRLAVSSDSLVAGSELVRSAAAVAPRRLMFQGDSLSLDVEIDELTVTGQVIPMQGGEIELIAGTGERFQAVADELGCFVIERPMRGPIRLRCVTRTSGYLTNWITL